MTEKAHVAVWGIWAFIDYSGFCLKAKLLRLHAIPFFDWCYWKACDPKGVWHGNRCLTILLALEAIRVESPEKLAAIIYYLWDYLDLTFFSTANLHIMRMVSDAARLDDRVGELSTVLKERFKANYQP